jgi:hypothetical protein
MESDMAWRSAWWLGLDPDGLKASAAWRPTLSHRTRKSGAASHSDAPVGAATSARDFARRKRG